MAGQLYNDRVPRWNMQSDAGPNERQPPHLHGGIAAIEQKNLVFVVGSPRSGTTWLQQMMAAHPGTVALDSELTVFTYLRAWERRYQEEKHHMDQGHWSQGAPLLYNEEEFYEGLQGIGQHAYAKVLAKNPEASHILDKHPGYALFLPLIDRLFPNSKVIHIIRDGREVVVSMLSAQERIGFGAGDVKSATRDWVQHIREARAASHLFGAARYMEVRYEELMAEPEVGLMQLFRFAGLEADPGMIASITRENHINTRQVSQGDTSLNTMRHTPGAIWQNRLGLMDRWTMDGMAGDLLEEFGYAEPGWWKVDRWDGLRLPFLKAKKRVLNTVGAALHIWNKPLAKRISAK